MSSQPTRNTADFMAQLSQIDGIEKLVQVVAHLRNPEHGCPWDLKQTHQSLRPYMLEEAYEVVEAIDEAHATGQPDALREELGDVLLQVVLHSQLAKDSGQFHFADVCNTLSDKLIRRHPHVFGDVTVHNADMVVTNWEAIKQAEKAKNASGENLTEDSILKGVSKGQPALSRALETSKKAVKVGFEWPSLDSLWACVMSEYDEFRDEVDALPPNRNISSEQFERIESEMGDILFASVNLARHFNIDPEIALTRATQKFTRRFQIMEALLRQQAPANEPLETVMKQLNFEQWDALWNQAKAAPSSLTTETH